MHASYAKPIASGVMLFAALFSLAGCRRGSHGPVRLENAPRLEQPTRSKLAKASGYRTESGSPIAPSIVPDDPPPPPPSLPLGDNSGSSGSRATLNGDPNGLTRETLNRAIQGAMGSLAGCFSSLTQDPMVSVAFEADPSGHPSLVRVGGAPPDAERCLRNVVQNLRFPAFEGKGVQVDLPLSFHRVARPSQAAPSAQQAPTAAPLFLEP